MKRAILAAAGGAGAIWVLVQRQRKKGFVKPAFTASSPPNLLGSAPPAFAPDTGQTANQVPQDTIRNVSALKRQVVLCLVLLLGAISSGVRELVILSIVFLGLVLVGASWHLTKKSSPIQTSRQEDPPPPEAPPVVNPLLTGTWVKDGRASDPMDPACDLMKLNGLVRGAVRLIKGLEVRLTPDTFHMAVFSVISWFKVRERYSLSGTVSTWSRRDLRRGQHRGHVEVRPDGGIRLCLEWDSPHGGQGTDDFVLVGDNELHVRSHIRSA
eukprot:CAMPEP_0202917478 /NCGR_PEP_ID=MMETSP1392-20130828/71079_1 /ASSEMBLY_ACC=CAM_ASM_000868 /TAXON_ID=225041 /ORGANISM="Chlamydomonas chlamydogama, Strain SAG 11-48b" /LENGTH=268 /DNA_ID=CAMNT_0049610239 /DNA_START=71 /DNA_END=874 /DNA_ORIENTATION=+